MRGNVNWMAARQASVQSPLFGADIQKLWPISLSGPVRHRLLRQRARVPAARRLLAAACGDDADPRGLGGQPADGRGPARLLRVPRRADGAVGRPGRDVLLGRRPYRRDARPQRPPSGALHGHRRRRGHHGLGSRRAADRREQDQVRSGACSRARCCSSTSKQGRIVSDEEIKAELAKAHPYKTWLGAHPDRARGAAGGATSSRKASDVPLLDRQQAFGYTQEDLKLLLTPMATTGQEAVGSMGTDTPISALSDKSKLLYTYFKQNFAQVTNPPIDSIREELVMSLVSLHRPAAERPRPRGPRHAPAARSAPADPHQRGPREDPRHRRHGGQPVPLEDARHHLPGERGRRRHGARRSTSCSRMPRWRSTPATTSSSSPTARSGRDRVAIPSLLATAGVHHHLIRKGLRTSVGLVVETGDAREIHHFCALAGYGAEAINPYLAFETLIAMKPDFPEEVDEHEVVYRYIKAIDKGILKVIAKMGISTYQSYCGAQIFDAVGLTLGLRRRATSPAPRPPSKAPASPRSPRRRVRRHRDAFGDSPGARGQPRRRRRLRLPPARRERMSGARRRSATCSTPRAATPSDKYREFARLVNETEDKYLTIRSLFRIKRRGGGRPHARAARGSRAGGRHRQALLDRRHVLRLDQPRGAHDARHRHEPDRRQVEHRRGRRGSRPLHAAAQRRLACARRSSRSPRAASA